MSDKASQEDEGAEAVSSSTTRNTSTTAVATAASASGGDPADKVNLVDRNEAPGGFPLVDPDRSGKKSQFDLVELATNIERADEFTRANAGSKLSVIAEQVRFLQEQARKALEEAELSKELHHIACNFKKIPGKVYYVYEKGGDGERRQKFMSMISPEEWGSAAPDFVAGYRLEHDMSWTPVEKLKERSAENEMIDKILRGAQAGGPGRLQLGFQ